MEKMTELQAKQGYNDDIDIAREYFLPMQRTKT